MGLTHTKNDRVILADQLCRGYRQWAYPDSVQRTDPTTFVVTATYGQNTVFDALTADAQRAIVEAEAAAAAAAQVTPPT